MLGERHGQFKRWLSRPPRPHGAILFDRRVSFLEVFYDLAYVAIIGQASHQLAEHISVRGVVEFAIIFGLIWFAWINGSLYVELHGSEEGRTRNIVLCRCASSRCWRCSPPTRRTATARLLVAASATAPLSRHSD